MDENIKSVMKILKKLLKNTNENSERIHDKSKRIIKKLLENYKLIESCTII